MKPASRHLWPLLAAAVGAAYASALRGPFLFDEKLQQAAVLEQTSHILRPAESVLDVQSRVARMAKWESWLPTETATLARERR